MDETDVLDVVVTDPLTGMNTGLANTLRRAIKALESSGVPYCTIGAVALAANGLPRMTRDIDLVVLSEDGTAAIASLRKANFSAGTPAGTPDDPESMIIFVDPQTNVEVDLLLAEGDPEALAIAEAPLMKIFRVSARVAKPEHLLLLYLYSNQPRHLGDFASIVKSGRADLAEVQNILADMHPEMIPEWKRRLKLALYPPPAPAKPKRRLKR